MSENAQRRSEGRARRRSANRERKPDEKHEQEHGEDGGMDGVHQAVRTAAAAAAVGAAVGAARALASRGADTTDADEHDETGPEAQQQPEEPEPQEDHDGDGDDGDGRQEASAVDPESHTEQEQSEPRQQRGRRTQSREERPRHGAPSDTVRSIVDRAREQLRELHGSDAESVTSLERIGDGWRVTFEVLEVERIPSSTDVLATYVVELDDDARLLSFERVRRYARAQSDRGDDR